MDSLLLDLRHALRSLRRAPGFALTAALSLALGIGVATAMFTVFQAVLLRPLPVRDADRVVALWSFRDPTVEIPVVTPEVDDVARASRMLSEVAGVVHWGAYPAPLEQEDHQPITLRQTVVTGNFFEVLGARPVIGRLLRREDGVTGAEPVAVLSYDAWRRHFGGDRRVLGRRLVEPTGGTTFTIVGVAPPGLDYPVGAEFWEATTPVTRTGMDVVARLAPGVSPGAARAEFLPLVRRLDRQYHIQLDPIGSSVRTLKDQMLGSARPILVALSSAVALLLLIACVNVGNLLLLRATLRGRELVIRRALGAGHVRIVRLLVVESALLGLAGGALGLVCAVGLLQALLALAPPGIPRLDLVRFAGTPAALAVGVTALAVLLFGVVPALLATRGDLGEALRADARSGSESRRRRQLRRLLVASQVALALIMLAGAGLLVRSLERLEHLDLGFDADRLAVVTLTIPAATYHTSDEYNAKVEQLYDAVRALPGVTALTPVLYPPYLGANLFQLRVVLPGQSPDDAAAYGSVPMEAGGSEYFRTFGIPIVRGRGVLDSDRAGSPKVAVVSEAVARRYWPGQDPIGQHFKFAGVDTASVRTVVGVAGDIRFRRLREPTPTIFVPWRQLMTFGTFALRTRGSFAPVLPRIRAVVRQLEPEWSIERAGTLDDYLAEPLAQPRLSTLLLSVFGVVALFLAAIGLYGVMASAVRERTRDLGVRMALGASPDRLPREVVTDALRVTGVGAVAGLALALLATRSLRALLFEVSPWDPLTLLGVCVLLLAVAVLAAYLPARRATRVDPVEALRAE